jgi:hypothetical protein
MGLIGSHNAGSNVAIVFLAVTEKLEACPGELDRGAEMRRSTRRISFCSAGHAAARQIEVPTIPA